MDVAEILPAGPTMSSANHEWETERVVKEKDKNPKTKRSKSASTPVLPAKAP